MTPSVEGPLEVAHVGILLWIDLRVREEHWEITRESAGSWHVEFQAANVLDEELHDGRRSDTQYER